MFNLKNSNQMTQFYVKYSMITDKISDNYRFNVYDIL